MFQDGRLLPHLSVKSNLSYGTHCTSPDRRFVTFDPVVALLGREFAIPILYVSHAMDEILNLATHMVVMEAGRFLACRDLEALFSRPELQASFGPDESVAVSF